MSQIRVEKSCKLSVPENLLTIEGSDGMFWQSEASEDLHKVTYIRYLEGLLGINNTERILKPSKADERILEGLLIVESS